MPSGRSRLAVVAIAFALAVAGCSDRAKDKAASQTAARINKEEVTVHQINFLLQQQRGLRPEQVDVATRQILEYLVDQELAVQRSRDLKIDQDPRVLLQLDAAKRDVLARAYAERIGESAGRPTAEEIKKYYDDKPSLFRERRIFNLQELAIDATPAQVPVLRDQLQRAHSPAEFVDYLRANNFRFNSNQGVRAAEQVPAGALDQLVKMKDGQTVLLPSPTGATILLLVGSRSEPVDEAHARPAIEQFLGNDAKRKRVEADIKALRTSAKIEYIGKFAEPTASAPRADPTPANAAAPAASGMSTEDVSKGMGIKK